MKIYQLMFRLLLECLKFRGNYIVLITDGLTYEDYKASHCQIDTDSNQFFVIGEM